MISINLLHCAVLTISFSACNSGDFGTYEDASYYPYEFDQWLYGTAPVQIPISSISDTENYDFIIIGSGSAGSVIANRLSEIGSWKILLLEAGLPASGITEFPTMAPALQFTEYNWGYITEPEPHTCLAMNQHRCAWPRGKALGGSSVINYMVYTRGNRNDYDRWAALGNSGWSYADVLPFFLKSEMFTVKNSNDIFHNKSGPMSVSETFISDVGNAFINAGKELGYKDIDYNGAEQIGFSRMQATLRQGRRESVANAFLKPILDRDNLRVLTGAKATKILINPTTNQAYGVEFMWKGTLTKAKATKEVILSAGSINSPQLLMLSGVGPKKHLHEFGIPTLSDLPVGQTLYDHMAFFGLVITTNLPLNATPTFDPVQLLQWYATGEGPLSSIGGNEGIAFVNTDTSHDYPDIELAARMGSIRTDNGAIEKRILGVSDDFYNQMYLPLQLTTVSFTIIPILLHPKSKGFLKLRSHNPHDYPLLYPKAYTDLENRDLSTMVTAIRLIMQLLETEAFRKINAQIYKKPFVGCEHLFYDSDEYWQCALQLMSSSTHHQTSTCKMGPIDDLTAVVNHKLKVYGIGNLRVADASVIPIPVSGHTNAPSIMVGEKAADLIKKDWGVLRDF